MEKWQIDHINRNLPLLMDNTNCEALFLAIIDSHGLITQEEKELLQLIGSRPEKSRWLYRVLQKREGAFDILKQALELTRQRYALRILDQCCGPEKWKKYGVIEFDANAILGYGSGDTKVFRGKLGRFRGFVAVKKLRCKNRDQISMTKEIEILRMLPSHSNIVQFFHAEMVYNKYILIAMEMCSCTVSDCVKAKNYPLEKPEILKQITEGLGFLHANNIIHRDLKPANVLVSITEKQFTLVKLSDFGQSKVIDSGRDTVTVTSFTGTISWTAPETLRQLEQMQMSKGLQTKLTQSYPVDIFSLGCIFFYVLTDGEHPFGDGMRCDINILDGRHNLDSLNKTESKFIVYVPIIRTMIANDASLRPSCEELLHRILTKDDSAHNNSHFSQHVPSNIIPNSYRMPQATGCTGSTGENRFTNWSTYIPKAKFAKNSPEDRWNTKVSKPTGNAENSKCHDIQGNFRWPPYTNDEMHFQENFLKMEIDAQKTDGNSESQMDQKNTVEFSFMKPGLTGIEDLRLRKLLNECNEEISWTKAGDFWYSDIVLGDVSEEKSVMLGAKHSKETTYIAVKKYAYERSRLMTLMNEVKAFIALTDNHHIIKYFSIHENQYGHMFVAMELCLHTVLNIDYDEMDENKTKTLLQQVANGVEFMHRNNITHKNLKPSNILLCRCQNGEIVAKVSDIGCCAYFYLNLAGEPSVGEISEYPLWQPPEVLAYIHHERKEPFPVFTNAVDIFSMGCIFYFVMSSGIHPFGNDIRCGKNILSSNYALLAENLKMTYILPLVLRMIHQKPTERPNSQAICGYFSEN